jgi:hypothetical protein
MTADGGAVPASASWKRLAAVGLIFLGVLAPSCRREGPPQIETMDNLLEGLGDLGAGVVDLGPAPMDGFGVEGARIRVDQAEIEVFEYESVEAREAISSTIPPEATAVGGLPTAWPDRPHIWAVGRVIVVYVGTDGGTVLLLSTLLGDSITEAAGAGQAPYPPGVTAAIRALAQGLGLDPGAVEVMAYEAAEWPDACLGLPDPGEACAEVITPGWRIRLRAAGDEYEVHTDTLGTVVRR